MSHHLPLRFVMAQWRARQLLSQCSFWSCLCCRQCTLNKLFHPTMTPLLTARRGEWSRGTQYYCLKSRMLWVGLSLHHFWNIYTEISKHYQDQLHSLWLQDDHNNGQLPSYAMSSLYQRFACSSFKVALLPHYLCRPILWQLTRGVDWKWLSWRRWRFLWCSLNLSKNLCWEAGRRIYCGENRLPSVRWWEAERQSEDLQTR